MASLKDLRDRIASVKATQKITKAMQMVAAAKLRRAQEAAEAARPYSQRMASVLANIAANVSPEDAPRLMAGTGNDQVHLVVVCTAERGLCGGFNSQIARHAREYIRTLLQDGKQVKLITVGKKGADILKRDFSKLIIDHVDLRDAKQVGFAHAQRISNKIVNLFNDGGFDVCSLFYSEFKSVINQEPTRLQLIPASAGDVVADNADVNGALYEYEPDAASILDELIPRNLTVQVFRALLENAAGEMGAKMSAMDNATRNAGDMINRLSITYNRQRQAQITTELIEIIAGAEAL
ncbi:MULTISPECIES: F0F1 ATP synthase subunit gamma [unclassified Bartonella]|uniref:F0F1 ATP synthase subunit gamma n=1 Tax=unclassified Bartonella TaxID=2645622 RepID=UPI0015FD8D4C|nr:MULTISPECIES: F0F1 ATP synthase subunit gamma [unclassified Bartonella]UXN03045.1 F0F1 ATP synthase subunit gamma [Bartonella sp. HY406]UXN06007.1 F0F1 ATP synthase subunit gamma [Bartonella sp. HY761]